LLFAGKKILWVGGASILFLLLILLTAQYPSSYPQDIGLLGIAGFLVLINFGTNKGKFDKILKFVWIIRFSIASVLILWAIDQFANVERHVGWLQLTNPLSSNLTTYELNSLLMIIASVEITLGVLLVLGKTPFIKHALIASTIFFAFAIMALEPPLNNHQTLGLIITTAWLVVINYRKSNLENITK